MALFAELKRRNIFRVAAGYALLAWLLIQASDILLGSFGAPAWVFQSLIVFLAIGFIIALFLAWAYELTPEGIQRTAPSPAGAAPAPSSGRRLDLLIVIGLVLVIVVLLAERFWFGPERTARASSAAPTSEQIVTAPVEPDSGVSAAAQADAAPNPRSVAVLPFVSMSGDPDNEYFSDGLTEELLNALAQVEGLQVAARTSSFRFKGETGDMADIARQLRVTHLLEGSVRRSGERVRITAQLINAADGFHLWSQTYDRQLADIFAIQDDIAGEVTRALRVRLLGAGVPSVPRPPTGNVAAYTQYLRGRQALQRIDYDTLEQADAAFREALALDPDFAAAHAGLAQTWNLKSAVGMVPRPAARKEMIPLVRRALELDPEQPLAWSLNAIIELEDEQSGLSFTERTAAAERSLRRALELEPGQPEASTYLAWLLRERGQTEESLILQLAVLARDPLSAQRHVEIAQLQASLDQFDQAVEHLQTAVQLAPDDPWPVMTLSWLRYTQGRIGEAIVERSRVLLLDPRDHEGLVRMVQYYLELNMTDAALPWLEAAERMAPEATVTRLYRALWHWRAGDRATGAALSTAALDADLPVRWGSRFMFETMESAHDLENGVHDRAIARLLARSQGALDPAEPDEPVDTEAFYAKVRGVELLGRRDGEAVARERAETLLAQVEHKSPESFNENYARELQLHLLSMLDRPEEMIALYRQSIRGNHELDAWFWHSTFPPLVRLREATAVRAYLAEIDAVRERERAWLAEPGRMPDPAVLLPEMARAAAQAPERVRATLDNEPL